MEVPDCAALTPGLSSRPRRWSPKEHSAFDGAESGSTALRLKRDLLLLWLFLFCLFICLFWFNFALETDR